MSSIITFDDHLDVSKQLCPKLPLLSFVSFVKVSVLGRNGLETDLGGLRGLDERVYKVGKRLD